MLRPDPNVSFGPMFWRPDPKQRLHHGGWQIPAIDEGGAEGKAERDQKAAPGPVAAGSGEGWFAKIRGFSPNALPGLVLVLLGPLAEDYDCKIPSASVEKDVPKQ